MSETFTFTHEELEQMVEEIREGFNVTEIVCVATGQRFRRIGWKYKSGIVTIDTTDTEWDE